MSTTFFSPRAILHRSPHLHDFFIFCDNISIYVIMFTDLAPVLSPVPAEGSAGQPTFHRDEENDRSPILTGRAPDETDSNEKDNPASDSAAGTQPAHRLRQAEGKGRA